MHEKTGLSHPGFERGWTTRSPPPVVGILNGVCLFVGGEFKPSKITRLACLVVEYFN